MSTLKCRIYKVDASVVIIKTF